MAKLTSTLSADRRDSLQELAERILRRADEVRVPAQKDQALELARLVLRENPKFGERELRDDEVIEMLRTQNIGVPTFRKCLSVVRKEVPKIPKRITSAKAPTFRSLVEPKPGPANLTETNRSIATNVDRNLL